jgi:PKD repeat protein
MSRIFGIAIGLLTLNAVAAGAATLTVCASGCMYSDPQAAVNAARYGDTVLLRAGETFVAHLLLPAKSGSGWIDIRSDAPDSELPGPSKRLVPDGRPGANTPRSRMARIVGRGGIYKTAPLLRAAPGAHGYRIRFVEIDGVAQVGYETLVQLGEDGTEARPYDIVLDRVYIHGHRTKGQKRALALHGVRLSVLNSYISDIMMVNADSQGIVGYNGAGPMLIENNFIEASGENILFGGGMPMFNGLVPSDITIRRNHLYKPLKWRDEILSRPSGLRAGSAVSGSLPSGTHYFKVVALMQTGARTAVSLASAEISVSVSSGRGVPLTWSGVSGADRYRIYRGTSAGGQSRYRETSSSSTSFTYTGASELSGSPASSGTRWTVKNLLELKNAERVKVEGNILENVWKAGQAGYAIVLTPRNEGSAEWMRVRDVSIVGNIIRGASGVLNVIGFDDSGPSMRTERVTVRNNLLYDIDPDKYGGLAKVFLIGDGPSGIVIDRNTIVHTNSSVLYVYGSRTVPGLVYTNNISRHNTYGILGEGHRTGLPTLTTYFPDGIVTCNVLAGGAASLYPATNAFPTVTEFNASFEDYAGEDYRLKSGSPVAQAGCGSTIPGVDFAALNAALGGSADPTEPTDPPASEDNTPPVARHGGPYSGDAGATVSVSGTASSDADGSIDSYRWTWGDDVLVRAANLPSSAIRGSEWVKESSTSAAGGVAIRSPNRNAAKRSTPLASPGSYVEFKVMAAAGVPYRLWMRLHASGDEYANDSLFVQFSGATSAAGTPIARIGSTSALEVLLEEGYGAGISGWGWNDNGWGDIGEPIYFSTSGLQTIRMQAREDGVAWDQLVLSSAAYYDVAPGLLKNDTVIVPSAFGSSSGASASHRYEQDGVYPLQLTVVDNDGAAATASTIVTIGDGTSGTAPPDESGTTVSRPGGPYTTAAGVSLAVNGATSSGADDYWWTWGDDLLVRAADLPVSAITGSEWVRESTASAAGGAALRNPNRNEAKRRTPSASPSSYVEFQVLAAAGVPYHLWMRLHASGDSYSNDSLFVQFSGATNAAGTDLARIGSTDALEVLLEEGYGAGVSGWGWNDDGWGVLGEPIYFRRSGVQTIRIQAREDGVAWDQLVLSSDAYFDTRPGLVQRDTTVLPSSFGGGAGAVGSHVYTRAGVYPLRLTVDGDGGSHSALTIVTVTSGGQSGTSGAPVAVHGGPYVADEGEDVFVDGSASSDANGSIEEYWWTWGDDVLVRAADLPVSAVHGDAWTHETVSAAAGGAALRNPNLDASKRRIAASSPGSFVEFDVQVAAGVPYRLWMRMHASRDDYSNDSLFVQFSGSTTQDGSAIARIGTSDAFAIVLEEGWGAGVSGWGWNDRDYGAIGEPIYFSETGVQTVRIQAREDGVAWDQFVLSSLAFAQTAPGSVRNDSTILPGAFGTSEGSRTSHRYAIEGVYPLLLEVVDDDGATGTADTTVTVGEAGT